MTERSDIDAVIKKAQSIFGDDAQRWLHKPNRSFAQLSPYELSQSEVGARVVLEELERTIRA